MILGDTPGKIANSLVLGIVLLGIAALPSAYGDTVLWHHFDEKAPGEATESSSGRAAGSENLGGLSAAFDSAFANVEWQPGESN